MVTARTVAMTANRLLDAKLDALNPRTARRAIPSGSLSPAFVGSVMVLCAATFIASTAMFLVVYHNRWPLILSGPTLLFVVAYPLLKRFTRLCHYYLGAALGLAPVCAWIAIRGDLSITPLLMGIAVLLWTAGFDIIYACQDYATDVEQGLFSVPSKIGIGPALWVSRLTHLACLGLMIAIGLTSSPPLGTLYFTGVGIAGILMIVEHSVVGADDLSKVGLAFFTINGIISLVLGTLGVLDVLVRTSSGDVFRNVWK
jgi:4-hydroxybenzoate polyprenyltransferase